MSSRYQETLDIVKECRMRSQKRWGMVQHLLSAVKEDNVETKRLCAQQLPYFYSQYPKLQYPIANSIYDLCEDSSSKVRMDAYQAILRISRFAPLSVKNNVDVLVQLLQTEEKEELAKIQDLLLEHIERFPEALLAIVERCQKPDPAEPPTNSISETTAVQTLVKALALEFLQSNQTILLLRRVLANDLSMCCFWGDMCKVKSILYTLIPLTVFITTIGVSAVF
ncbi:hypothetical protein BDV93DRAFT_204316 [Ceratobasidium sp. AG-I]|nr:hypothetical protein BDV93DRAFT_204316 [Ceratobasidium sp. AG-I]